MREAWLLDFSLKETISQLRRIAQYVPTSWCIVTSNVQLTGGSAFMPVDSCSPVLRFNFQHDLHLYQCRFDVCSFDVRLFSMQHDSRTPGITEILSRIMLNRKRQDTTGRCSQNGLYCAVPHSMFYRRSDCGEGSVGCWARRR